MRFFVGLLVPAYDNGDNKLINVDIVLYEKKKKKKKLQGLYLDFLPMMNILAQSRGCIATSYQLAILSEPPKGIIRYYELH